MRAIKSAIYTCLKKFKAALHVKSYNMQRHAWCSLGYRIGATHINYLLYFK